MSLIGVWLANSIFLTHTKPDLLFVVQHLSQYLQRPTQCHLDVALYLLRYLRGSSDFGLLFSNSPSFSLSAYCDSDWASCPDTRRSVTGFYVLLGNSLITWKAKKQLFVSLSSTEVEYRSCSKVVAELVWVLGLLADFGLTVSSHVPMYCDNRAAIHISRNLVFHERMKHIEVACHFVRSQVAAGLVDLRHVPTSS